LGYLQHRYPFGRSHCCLKNLGFALAQYAEEHNGRFPAGKACPEASLSLLYGDTYGVDAEVLRGKTVPVEQVEQKLKNGELLDPETCGWHYVEGLTLVDDPEIAIAWDKVGLGHSGERLGGGHSVWFLGDGERIVPASEWPAFLERQETLMANRTAAAKAGTPVLAAQIRLPSGEIVDRYDGQYLLKTVQATDRGSHSSSQSGVSLVPSALRWYRISPGNGTMTLNLSLSEWKSQPVRVGVSEGRATPNTIIFDMAARK